MVRWTVFHRHFRSSTLPLRHHLNQIRSLACRLPARAIYYYPKVISAKARRLERHNGILGTTEGGRRFENGRFAIFLIWQPKAISWYVQNALDALAETETNVILVANHQLSDEIRRDLAGQSHTVIVRDNTGFDIGGYKDATLHVLDNHQFDRLLYINDSIFFFREGLAPLFQRLIHSAADICTAFENFERRYHIQSFCFSVSSALAYRPQYAGFWKNYLAVSARRWAIHKGEIDLSRRIVPLADNVEVIYSPNDLRPFIKNIPPSEILSLNKYLPFSQRMDHAAARLRTTMQIEEIIQRVATRSQIHTGGFLYHRFLNCPIIKRDLVYRLQFSIYDIEQCLIEAGSDDHVEEILSELRKKGPGSQLPFLKRIQFEDGII